MATDTKDLEGIGGWLLLVVLGLIVSPIRIAMMLSQNHFTIFSDGTWEALTSPESDSYHSLWAPLLSLEIAGNVLTILLALITLCFLVMKSKHTPKVAITWLLFGLVFVASDFVLAQQIPLIAEQPADPETIKELVRSVVGAAIWVPYFLVSKRVRATFSREWPNNSFKPTPLRGAA
ncbi:DUF2569 domain-containing protein [Luteimonas sp. A534]